MDCIEAIVGRRSIRRYTEEPVSEEQIETLLRAAMAAPSAFNERSSRFVVVTDAEVLSALSETHQFSKMIARAPLAIVVCGDRDAERYPGFYWTQDCTAALTNLLTAAQALGLGACWVGVQPWPDRVKHVRGSLGLPLTVEPLALVSLGHPAEVKPPADRYDPSFVHRDRWSDAATSIAGTTESPGNADWE
jgi:nitroreductase